MSKELPYVDEQGQLHYEAYVGKGRAILRESLPKDHPEHLYNYLQRHGIDWKLFFEDDGRRKGIDHEHGPVEKLLGLDKKGSLDDVFGMMPGKERVEYTRADMERAFAAGGANAAKERVSGNKLTLPVLDFDQWMNKYHNETEKKTDNRLDEKEIILSKIGLQERGAFNILKDKKLCNRILNEKPIWIEDFLKKYDVSKTIIKDLIDNCIIYCFSNVDNKGSKQFIFEDEALSQFSLKSNPIEVYKNIREVINLFLEISATFLTEKEHDIVTSFLINKMPYDEIAEKYNITRTRLMQLFDKSLRRMRYRIRTQEKFEELNKQYIELQSEYNFLKSKHEELKQNDDPNEAEEEKKIDTILRTEIYYQEDLSVRTHNVLRIAEIETVFELLCLDLTDIFSVRGAGRKTLTELEDFVRKYGLRIGMLSKFKGQDYYRIRFEAISLIRKEYARK